MIDAVREEQRAPRDCARATGSGAPFSVGAEPGCAARVEFLRAVGECIDRHGDQHAETQERCGETPPMQVGTMRYRRSDMGELADQAAEKGTAPNSDREHSAEEHHCIDTRAPLLGPVHVLEVEPEREFIERQRRGTAVEN